MSQRGKSFLAFLLAAGMCTSILGVSAAASDTYSGSVDTPAGPVEVSYTYTQQPPVSGTDPDGNSTETETSSLTWSSQPAASAPALPAVSGQESTAILTVTTPAGTPLSRSEVTQGSQTISYEQQEAFPRLTVEVMQDSLPTETATDTAPGQKPSTVDNMAEQGGSNEKNYDKTTTSSTDRTLSASLSRVEVSLGDGNFTDKEIGLTPVNPEWNEEKQQMEAPALKLSGEELTAAGAEKPEGYDYLYVGNGEDSMFGTSYWVTGEGQFTGEQVTGTTQFQLADFSDPYRLEEDTLKLLAAYCADLDTGSKPGWWYRVENLEDADYYRTEDAADHIRAIALHGYWGCVGNQIDGNGQPILDEAGNPIPETGSLAAVKALMAAAVDGEGNALFTEEEIDALTEGEAMAATQMAIWHYGSPYDSVRTQANLMDAWVIQERGNGSKYRTPVFFDPEDLGLTEEQAEASCRRIDELTDYLVTLRMTEEQAGTTRILDQDSFIRDMSMTVGDKSPHHANNLDQDSGNDAYLVDLTFSLVVTPHPDNDDLVVKVLNSSGEVVKTARIAGNPSGDEGFGNVTVNRDPEGNVESYTLTDLELIEGSDTRFNLKLEGAQYLERGVYIYTSEQKDYTDYRGEVTENAPSQTFVGVAEGYRSVDVAMEVELAFQVEESVITMQQVWQNTRESTFTPGHDGPGEDPIPPSPPPSAPIPPSDVPPSPEVLPSPEAPPSPPEDPEIVPVPSEQPSLPSEPLIEVPATGDRSLLWLLPALLSGSCLVAVVFRGGKNSEAE